MEARLENPFKVREKHGGKGMNFRNVVTDRTSFVTDSQPGTSCTSPNQSVSLPPDLKSMTLVLFVSKNGVINY